MCKQIGSFNKRLIVNETYFNVAHQIGYLFTILYKFLINNTVYRVLDDVNDHQSAMGGLTMRKCWSSSKSMKYETNYQSKLLKRHE